MTKDEALKLALEALERALSDDRPYIVQCKEAITAIREALAQPEIPMQNNNPGLEWDKIPKSFDDWWDSDYDPTGNPFQHETPAYWAWAGWKASSVATNDTSQERVDEIAKQRHEAQPEHSCVACEGNPKGNNNPCAVCGLAQPEQKPVAWASKRTLDCIKDFDGYIYANGGFDDAVPLYTTPPQRKPLSDEEIDFLWRKATMKPGLTLLMVRSFARAIEATHGIKE